MSLVRYSTPVLTLVFIASTLMGCSDTKTESEDSVSTLETAQVNRGEISKIINGTGSVRPEIAVEVGSEVSGRLLSVQVDFNSKVKKGDLLAKLDAENLENRVSQNMAQVENRRADIQIQEASLRRARVNAAQAKRSLDRRRQLSEENAISQAQLEETDRAMKLAEADIEVAEARLAGAQSALKQAEANLRVSKVDLSRTIIRAPIDGVVIERLVDPGQTVAASFSAPKLFIIAGDLSKIKVDAAIVEGDVSGLDDGDTATFSVDAYPGRVFIGKVEQLRFKSKSENNIVTYTAVIVADNLDNVLMPGMTANLQITTNSKTDILRIPASAERFRPTPDQIKEWKAEDTKEDSESEIDAKLRARLRSINIDSARIDTLLAQVKEDGKDLREKIADPTQNWRRVSHLKALRDLTNDIVKDVLNSTEYQDYRQKVQAEAKIRDAEIWIKDGEKMRQKTVSLGLSDGSYTEVVSGIDEGDVVITSIKKTTPDRQKQSRK